MACQQLNKSSALKLIRDMDTFVFDCDGVLWNPQGLIKGSLETVNKLTEMGKKVCYITNNCSNTRAQYARKLNKHGFPAGETDVICPSYMAAAYLTKVKFKGKVYLIGNPNIAAELDAQHMEHFGGGPDPISGEIDDWLNLRPDPDVKCVLVGSDRYFSYMKIIRAARYLERADCMFLATNLDPTFPPVKVQNDLGTTTVRVPGTGCLVRAVTHATRREPVHLGKPRSFMYEELKKIHNLQSSRCVMIGDTLESDIGLAKACGMKSVLVLSGVTTKSQLPSPPDPSLGGSETLGSSTDPPLVPDFFTSCAGDLTTLLQ